MRKNNISHNLIPSPWEDTPDLQNLLPSELACKQDRAQQGKKEHYKNEQEAGPLGLWVLANSFSVEAIGMGKKMKFFFFPFANCK